MMGCSMNPPVICEQRMETFQPELEPKPEPQLASIPHGRLRVALIDFELLAIELLSSSLFSVLNGLRKRVSYTMGMSVPRETTSLTSPSTSIASGSGTHVSGRLVSHGGGVRKTTRAGDVSRVLLMIR
jgi:hypothetical protein